MLQTTVNISAIHNYSDNLPEFFGQQVYLANMFAEGFGLTGIPKFLVNWVNSLVHRIAQLIG